MANYEATRYDFDGANLTDVEGVNTGIIIPWSDTTAPSGFLECDGSAVSRSTYSALFAVVGTTYGAGNGSTTFNVPNLQDDVVVGKSPTKALASTGGANTVTQSGNLAFSIGQHSLTTPEIPSHSHSGPTNSTDFQPNLNRTQDSMGMGQGTGGVGNQPWTVENTGTDTGHSHPGSANFAGDANSVLQPYLTVMYVIKT
jgi:microcystin-dependent protein